MERDIRDLYLLKFIHSTQYAGLASGMDSNTTQLEASLVVDNKRPLLFTFLERALIGRVVGL
ncbi:hypothetical protein VCRA2133E348_280061 [Vibrio crassostreae]|nr:hypothetical protein VCRA2133E348_280061 [Vibrio crassostreae]CAK3140269.1 hypothetical protein VCRA213O314_120011 [Vibrio crassostreae]